jgi:hypothetical protein
MAVTAETRAVQAAVVRRMMPLLMAGRVLRNPPPGRAGQLLRLTVVIGTGAQVAEGPAVRVAPSRAPVLRQAVAVVVGITAAVAAELQYKP